VNNLGKQYINLFQDIQSVKEDVLEKFPNVPHTIRILLWDDETRTVECSYSDEDDRKHISRIYNGILSHEKVDITGKVMILNDFGIEEYYKLVKL